MASNLFIIMKYEVRAMETEQIYWRLAISNEFFPIFHSFRFQFIYRRTIINGLHLYSLVFVCSLVFEKVFWNTIDMGVIEHEQLYTKAKENKEKVYY